MNGVLFSKATQARLRSSLGEAKGTNFHWRHHKLVVGYERSILQMAIYLLPFMWIVFPLLTVCGCFAFSSRASGVGLNLLIFLVFWLCMYVFSLRSVSCCQCILCCLFLIAPSVSLTFISLKNLPCMVHYLLLNMYCLIDHGNFPTVCHTVIYGMTLSQY